MQKFEQIFWNIADFEWECVGSGTPNNVTLYLFFSDRAVVSEVLWAAY